MSLLLDFFSVDRNLCSLMGKKIGVAQADKTRLMSDHSSQSGENTAGLPKIYRTSYLKTFSWNVVKMTQNLFLRAARSSIWGNCSSGGGRGAADDHPLNWKNNQKVRFRIREVDRLSRLPLNWFWNSSFTFLQIFSSLEWRILAILAVYFIEEHRCLSSKNITD